MLGKNKTGERKIARNQFIRKVLPTAMGPAGGNALLQTSRDEWFRSRLHLAMATIENFDWLRRPIDGRTCV